MHWFEGDISSAIAKAKQTKAVFVIFIKGEDELSKQMCETWEDTSVSTLCQQEKMVTMQLQANSESCRQFSQIYPVFCVPATFFIGTNGVPLEVVGGHLSSQEFTVKINKVIEMHKASSDGEVAATSATPSTSQESIASPDLDVRVATARDKIKEKQEMKRQEEMKEGIRKELERRKVGQSIQELSRKQQEEKSKELAEEIKKQKAEEKAAKQKIREQIARDREERAAQFQQQKEERVKAQAAKSEAKKIEEQQVKQQTERSKMESARIQFRLPDGSSIMNTFPSDKPLSDAKKFLYDHIGNIFGQFTLSSVYPRRQFTELDMNTSLLDLDLAPSASLVVLPGSKHSASKPDSNPAGLFALLLMPFLWIWSLVVSIFISSSEPESITETRIDNTLSTPSTSQTTKPETKEESTSRPVRPVRPKSSYMRRRTAPDKGQSPYRREGNINKFSNPADDDDDDDNNTWNGNSTQQM